MREIILHPSETVRTLVALNIDSTLIDWCQVAAKPAQLVKQEHAHDKQLECLAQLIGNLTLPLSYITETPSLHGAETLAWLSGQGFPPQRLYARGEGNILERNEFYLNALEQALDDHDMDSLIYIDDGLNLEMQIECEERGWLHLSI